MKIGFTGPRKGMQCLQWVFTDALIKSFGENAELHHGGAIGADFQAREIARVLELPTFCYPSNLPKTQVKPNDTKVYEAQPPLERNRAIVDTCDVLIAIPEGEEVQSSGTWATIRYARKAGKPRVIIYPDGRTIWEKELPK